MDNNQKSPEQLALEEKDKRTNLKKFCNSILQKIGELDNCSGDRAIWELCQNARDLSPNTVIKITLDKDNFTFAHQGEPFDNDSLLSLVKQVSSEGKENTETAGQFGTGFVTTHYFSRKFYLNGSFRTDTGKVFDLDHFEIDRSEDNIEKFIAKMDQQIQAVYELLNTPESTIRKWTELIYPLSDESLEIAFRAMRASERMMPEVLVLNDRIKSVTLDNQLDHRCIVYTKGESSEENGLHVQIIQKIIDNGEHQTIQIFFLQEGENKIILPLENAHKAKSVDGIAKLFIWFPLLGTEDWGSNFVYHSSFYPLERRNGVVIPCENRNQRTAYEHNLNTFEDMDSLMFEYLKEHAGEIDNSIMLSKINYLSQTSDDSLTQGFFVGQQKKWTDFFRSLPLIDTPDGRKSLDEGVQLPDRDICIFFTDEDNRAKYFNAYYEYASRVSILPSKEICLQWADIIHQWNIDDEEAHTISLEAVAKAVTNEGDFSQLHDFLQIVKQTNHPNLFEKFPLIPNREGDLRITANLRGGQCIPDELYHRARPICPSEMDKLVHQNFADIFSLTEYTRDNLRSAILNVHERMKNETIRVGRCFSNEYTSSLRQFVSIYSVEKPENTRHLIMQRLAELKGFDYQVCYIPRTDENERDYTQSAFIFLLESELLDISLSAKNDTEWLKNHKTQLLNLIVEVAKITNQDDSPRLLGSKGYAVIPNQSGTLCKLEDLKIREEVISDDLADLYYKVKKEEMRDSWVDPDFEQFVANEKTDKAKDIASTIESTLLEEYENTKEVSQYVIDIIQKIESKAEGFTWKNWFKRIDEKKADLNWHIVPEESKGSFYRLMKVASNKELLQDLAEISENASVLRQFKDFLAKRQQEEAEFKFKYDLGKHIEDLVRQKLSQELCARINIATTIEDRQGGQDIVIQLDGEDVYFIECKAKWNFSEPAHMSKLQIKKACEEKGHYALCAVDLTEFDGLGDGAFPSIDQLERHIHIHFDVADRLANVTDHLFAIDEESDENRMTISADYRSNIPKSVFVNNIGFHRLIDDIISHIHALETE